MSSLGHTEEVMKASYTPVSSADLLAAAERCREAFKRAHTAS